MIEIECRHCGKVAKIIDIEAHNNRIRAEERERVIPTHEELKAIKQAVCAAIANQTNGYEIADNYYHKLKSLRSTKEP